MNNIQHVRCAIFHNRRGRIRNRFRYQSDYLLLRIDELKSSPSCLLSINRFNVFSFYDHDHGAKQGTHEFAQHMLKTQGLESVCDGAIYLLTQPRFLGFVFNPVSFWYFHDQQQNLRAVVAEVNNTFGQRHCYVCHHDSLEPITQNDQIQVQKAFHVSPFQDVSGHYTFRFQFDEKQVGAWIDYRDDKRGVFTSVNGQPRHVTTTSLIASALLRPFGALRVVILIHWQALKLKLKGARYRAVPKQQNPRVSR